MHALDLSCLNILLLDDSRSIRVVLKTLLRGLGVSRIYESRDSEEALVTARLSRPDLVLVDHDLGSASGLDAVRRFRDPAHSPDTGLPIIFLAPPSLPYLGRAAESAGADAVLPKPVNAATLGQRIDQLMRPGLRCADPAFSRSA
ncbi:response regulator [Maricaulis sp.]|uniref:response regulator n=1 Tax=Maricaulis sp. TaxID=1486257 RepID=UPI003A934922